MPTTPLASPRDIWSSKVVETGIRLSMLVILLVWCFQLLQPFILPFLWAVIIAVAIHPLYVSLVKLLQGRSAIAAALVTIGFLVILMVPSVMLTKLLVENVAELADGFREGRLDIPPPPPASENGR